MAVQVGDEFKANDVCLRSGVYKVTHDPAHAPEHEVTCIKGRKFPRCRTCGHPRFVLVKGAHRVETHELFRDQL